MIASIKISPPSSKPHIVLTTGGTGGHIFPAAAVAEVLLARGYHLHLLSDRRNDQFKGILSTLPGVQIHSETILGKSKIVKILALVKIILGICQAFVYLIKIKPVLVIGFGGYSSVPALLAAQILHIDTVLHEQNAVLGRANRLGANHAIAIALGFPNTEKITAKNRKKAKWIGNPVRAEIVQLAGQSYHLPQGDKAKLNILITGGSQGAKILSQVIPDALGLMSKQHQQRIHLIQQTRPDDLAVLKQRLTDMDISCEVKSFFHDIHEKYQQCHLVIARAGASTIAELTVVGRPAILSPYPYSADQHQAVNAARVSDIAGAWTIPQADFTPQWLSHRLEQFLEQPQLLEMAAQSIRKLAKLKAAEDFADMIELALKIK